MRDSSTQPQAFPYDALNRLTTAQATGGITATRYGETYSFDSQEKTIRQCDREYTNTCARGSGSLLGWTV